MSQFARPSSDVSTGGWTSAPLWSKIDEASAGDSDYVSSALNPDRDTFECALSAVSVPQPGLPHTLTVRLRRTADEAANPGWTTIALMEGGRAIASKLVQPAVSSFTNEAITLTQEEVDSITDFSNLRVSVTAGVPVVVVCSQCPVAPQRWKLSVSGITNGECTECGALNGDFTLNHISGCNWATDSVSACEPAFPTWSLFYGSNTWFLQTETMGAGLGPVQYTLAASLFRCLQPNTLVHSGDSGFCATFPDQLTIIPD